MWAHQEVNSLPNGWQKLLPSSNHLRGICILSLSENRWVPQRAAQSLSESRDRAVTAKLEGKMRRYLEKVRQNVSAGTEKKLFNSLPVAYHEPLKMAIAWARRRNQVPANHMGEDIFYIMCIRFLVPC